MNALESLDYVTAKLLAQNAPCVVNGCCALRDFERGQCCAVGFLIDDEHYEPSFEGAAALHSKIRQAVRASGHEDLLNRSVVWRYDEEEDEGEGERGVLSVLMDIHDGNAPHEWPALLAELRAKVVTALGAN